MFAGSITENAAPATPFRALGSVSKPRWRKVTRPWLAMVGIPAPGTFLPGAVYFYRRHAGARGV